MSTPSKADFNTILLFQSLHPALARVHGMSGCAVGSAEYADKAWKRFVRGHMPAAFTASKSLPDPIMGTVLTSTFNVSPKELPKATKYHSQAMIAENAIGEYLERYINSVMSKHKWVWVTGELLRGIDFIGPLTAMEPFALQVKNRNTSENSSSSKIRSGTNIVKWYRLNSRTGATNWDKFPYYGHGMTEKGFQDFVAKYLAQLYGKIDV